MTHKPLEIVRYITRKECVVVFLIVLASRLLLLWLGVWCFDFDRDPERTAFTLWKRWDAVHYLKIASDGYHPPGLDQATREFISRFPPLYPLFVRIFIALTMLPVNTAAIILNWILLFFSACLVLVLTRRELGDDRAAHFAALFVIFHPASYFASAPYSEPLFIFLSALYFYSIRFSERFGYSALFLSGLVLTRIAGVTALPVHLLVFFRRFTQGRAAARDVIYAALPFGALGAFYAYTAYYSKLPGYFGLNRFRAGAMNFNFIPFGETYDTAKNMIVKFPGAFSDEFFMETVGWSHVALVTSVVIIALAWKKLALEYRVYAVCYFLLLSLISFNICSLRFTFALLPLFLALGMLRMRLLLLVLSFAALLLRARIFVLGAWGY